MCIRDSLRLPPSPRQAAPGQWLHYCAITSVTRDVLCCGVSDRDETPQHKTLLSFSLSLEMHHAVLLERASLHPSRLWVLPRCYCSVVLICPHSRSYYRGITTVAVTVSSTNSHAVPSGAVQTRAYSRAVWTMSLFSLSSITVPIHAYHCLMLTPLKSSHSFVIWSNSLQHPTVRGLSAEDGLINTVSTTAWRQLLPNSFTHLVIKLYSSMPQSQPLLLWPAFSTVIVSPSLTTVVQSKFMQHS